MQLAWTVKAGLRADGSEILGIPEAQLLHRAVVTACDMNDGVEDSLIGEATMRLRLGKMRWRLPGGGFLWLRQ